MSDNLKCHACGMAMVRDVRPNQVTYQGHAAEIEQPGWYCTSCDEVVLVGRDADVTEEAFVELKARVDGILPPSEVRRIRVKLGLSQRRASALLGGGPRSFQKYESGTDWITRSMANLLRLLDKDPARLQELIDPNAEPPPGPGRRRSTGPRRGEPRRAAG